MYDVIVIGGGPGGYAAAIRASQLKGKVVLVEGGHMGGTCVMRGCIPSKLWLRAAELLEQSRKADEFGLQLTVGKLDYSAVVAPASRAFPTISAWAWKPCWPITGPKWSTARPESPAPPAWKRAAKAGGQNIIVATGSAVAMPSVPGLEGAALTTDQLLDMTEAPASVLITDPTYIGVEMAMLLSILGSKVVYAVPGPRILPDEDQDSSQRLAQSLRERGVQIMPRHTLVKVSGKACTLKSGDKEQAVEVDKVLVSGRKPVNQGLGLEALGVQFKEDGGIVVDEHCRTACPTIYAIGDCTGGWMLSHAASAMAICAAENCLGKTAKFPAHLVSRAIWGIPQMGSVGLSEEQAERAGYDVEVGGFPYSINGYAMLRGEVDGAVKMVSDAATGEILGVHIVGSCASEIIGEAVLAMQLECTVAEFAKGFRVHPAFSETVVDAARDAAGWALYLPKRN